MELDAVLPKPDEVCVWCLEALDDGKTDVYVLCRPWSCNHWIHSLCRLQITVRLITDEQTEKPIFSCGCGCPSSKLQKASYTSFISKKWVKKNWRFDASDLGMLRIMPEETTVTPQKRPSQRIPDAPMKPKRRLFKTFE